jgi:hypothetical protein
MHSYVITCLSLSLVVTVLAFVREARLRRALQQLLARLLSNWRNNHAPTHSASHDSPGHTDGPV